MSDIQSGILANFAPAVRLPRAAGAPALPAHPPANQALVCLGELRAQLRAILSPDWARELSAEQELRWRTQARRVFRQEVAATVRFLRQLRPTPQSERRSGPASAEPGETSGLRPLARFRSLRLGLDLSNRPAGRLDQGYFSKIFQDVVKPDTVRLRTMADYQPLISEMKADLGHYRCLSQSDSTLKEQEPAPTGQGYLASIYADLVKPAIHFTANFRPEAYTALPRPDRLTNLPSLQPLTELPPRTGPVTNPASKPQTVPEGPKEVGTWASGVTNWVRGKLGVGGDIQPPPVAASPTSPVPDQSTMSGENKPQAEAPTNPGHSWWSGATSWASSMLGINGENKSQSVVADAPKDSWWSGITGWVSSKLGIDGESKPQSVVADAPKDPNNSWWSGITGWISEKLDISGESKTQPAAIAEAPKDPDTSWWSGITGW
ncbi:hypothetical protein JST97_30515, partial [bacterium]|nr:hypothetical protein [bacterium]